MSDRLLFEDIDEWTPSSISIVDEPFHPCCHFEVYEDDEEYVKKSIAINDGEIMVEDQSQNIEAKVEVSESFLERLLGRSISKSADETVEKADEQPSYDELLEKYTALEERVAKLEEEKKPTEPVQDAVQKSEGETGETEGESSEEEATEEIEETSEEEETEETVDESEVVSKSVDPDLVTTNSAEKSLVERAGRKVNGMTW